MEGCVLRTRTCNRTEKDDKNGGIAVVDDHPPSPARVIWHAGEGLSVKDDPFRERIHTQWNVRRVIVLAGDGIHFDPVGDEDFI